MASKNKNSFAIAKYTNASNHYVTNVIKNGDNDNVNGFKLFTRPLSYFKTKLQKKHYDVAHTPYKVTMDNVGNAYNVWNEWENTVISNNEIKQIEKICLIALEVMAEKGLKLTKSNLLDFIGKTNPMFYTNGVDIVGLIKQYKKLHGIKPSTDTETLVFRKPTWRPSVSAKRLGNVVK